MAEDALAAIRRPPPVDAGRDERARAEKSKVPPLVRVSQQEGRGEPTAAAPTSERGFGGPPATPSWSDTISAPGAGNKPPPVAPPKEEEYPLEDSVESTMDFSNADVENIELTEQRGRPPIGLEDELDLEADADDDEPEVTVFPSESPPAAEARVPTEQEEDEEPPRPRKIEPEQGPVVWRSEDDPDMVGAETLEMEMDLLELDVDEEATGGLELPEAPGAAERAPSDPEEPGPPDEPPPERPFDSSSTAEQPIPRPPRRPAQGSERPKVTDDQYPPRSMYGTGADLSPELAQPPRRDLDPPSEPPDYDGPDFGDPFGVSGPGPIGGNDGPGSAPWFQSRDRDSDGPVPFADNQPGGFTPFGNDQGPPEFAPPPPGGGLDPFGLQGPGPVAGPGGPEGYAHPSPFTAPAGYGYGGPATDPFAAPGPPPSTPPPPTAQPGFPGPPAADPQGGEVSPAHGYAFSGPPPATEDAPAPPDWGGGQEEYGGRLPTPPPPMAPFGGPGGPGSYGPNGGYPPAGTPGGAGRQPQQAQQAQQAMAHGYGTPAFPPPDAAGPQLPPPGLPPVTGHESMDLADDDGLPPSAPPPSSPPPSAPPESPPGDGSPPGPPGEPPGHGGDLFEIDMGEAALAAPGEPPPEGPDLMDGKPRSDPSARERARERAKKRLIEQRKARIVVAGGLLVLLAAAAFALYELGIIGDRDSGGEGGEGDGASLVKKDTKSPAKPRGPIIGDSIAAYRARIEDLTAEAKGYPGDPRPKGELAWALLRFEARYPRTFAADEELTAQRKKVVTAELLARSAILRDLDLIIREQPLPEGEPEGEGVETDFVAGLEAGRNGELEAGVRRFEAVIAEAENHEAALYELALLRIAEENDEAATAALRKLVELDDRHAGAKLRQAQLALANEDLDAASNLNLEALGVAKSAGDLDDQFAAQQQAARIAAARGAVEDQIYALDQALEIDPGSEEVAVEVAGLLIDADRATDALARLKLCEKSGCSSPEFQLVSVLAYEKAGQKESANSQLDAALKLYPDDPDLQMRAADRELREQRFQKAKAIYATIIAKNPEYGAAYLGLADLMATSKEPEQAIETLEEGLEKAGDKRLLLQRMAELQMSVGDTMSAKETLHRILELDPNQTTVKLRFATLLLELGFLKESVTYFEELDEAGALDTKARLAYTEALFGLGKHEEALKQLDAATDEEVLSVDAHIMRGAINTALGEYRKADRALREALKLNADSAKAYRYLGQNDIARGRWRAAVQSLAKAVELDPDDLAARKSLATILSGLGGQDNRRQALAHYNHIIKGYKQASTALEKKRIDAEVYLGRARILFENGQYQKALADIHSGLLVEPGNTELLVAQGMTLLALDRDDEAEDALDTVLDEDSANIGANFYAGMLAVKQKHYKAAETHFKRVVAKDQGGRDYPDAYRFLGYLHRDRGNRSAACKAFKAYLREAPRKAYERKDVRRLYRRLCR